MAIARAAVLGMVMIGVIACGGLESPVMRTPEPPSAIPEPPSVASTLVYKGQWYTCETVQGLDEEYRCPSDEQEVFDKHKHYIEGYANSGQLGPLNDDVFDLGDMAYVGLTACVFRKRGKSQDEYIHWLLADQSLVDKLDDVGANPKTAFLPAWFEAPRSLCPNDAGEDRADGRTKNEQVDPIPGVKRNPPGRRAP